MYCREIISPAQIQGKARRVGITNLWSMTADKTERIRLLAMEAKYRLSVAGRQWNAGLLTDQEVQAAYKKVVNLLSHAIAALDEKENNKDQSLH